MEFFIGFAIGAIVGFIGGFLVFRNNQGKINQIETTVASLKEDK